jgi:hypothetical protein
MGESEDGACNSPPLPPTSDKFGNQKLSINRQNLATAHTIKK